MSWTMLVLFEKARGAARDAANEAWLAQVPMSWVGGAR